MTLPISIADVESAAERISPFARVTPVAECTQLNRMLDAQIFCKAEMLQRTGSFKFRGAMSALRSLSPEERAEGVLTYSSGNHGQAISRAAGLLEMSATVVMPSDAPEIKKAATKYWGATVVEYDRYAERREDVAARIQADSDATLIPPFNHPLVMAGQGTLALELFNQVPDLDMIVVCLGGGGLLAGCATVARSLSPTVQIVGVEPEAGNDHVLSREAGKRITLPDVPRTIADGQQTLAPGELTWLVNEKHVNTFTTVSDVEIVEAMRFLFAHHKLVTEPSGATALAAAMRRRIIEPGMRVGVTLSGGNVDLARFNDLVS